MTDEQRTELDLLVRELRIIACPVGPLHSYWDLIRDLEELRDGRKGILNLSVDEYLAMAREWLEDRRRL